MFHVFPRSLFGKGNGSRRFSMFVLRSMLVQIVLAIAVAVPAVGANADASATPLEPLTVTATQIRQSAFDVPYSASVITAHDLRERQVARTLTDGLGETPGIMVQKTGYGQASPYMRGFTGFRTLMLVDGIRLNNAVFREGPNQYWATVDLFAVDRLEVVKGASSVIHGSDAVGGTGNAVTQQPRLGKHNTERAWSATKATYRYASAEDSHIVRAEAEVGMGQTFGLHTGLTYKQFDDLRAGRPTGLQPGTGYDQRDLDLSTTWRPVVGLELRAAYQRTEQDNVPRTHATTAARSFRGTAVGTDRRRDLDQLRELTYLQAERSSPSWLDHALFSISRHRQEEEQDRIRSNNRREITGFRDDQFGVFGHATKETEVGVLVAGVEYYRDDVDSWGSDIAPQRLCTGTAQGQRRRRRALRLGRRLPSGPDHAGAASPIDPRRTIQLRRSQGGCRRPGSD